MKRFIALDVVIFGLPAILYSDQIWPQIRLLSKIKPAELGQLEQALGCESRSSPALTFTWAAAIGHGSDSTPEGKLISFAYEKSGQRVRSGLNKGKARMCIPCARATDGW